VKRYAIIETGGKQYKVSEGDELDIERTNLPEGSVITLNKVLLTSDGKDITVGSPYLKDVCVSCDYLSPFKAGKVISFKYRRRKSSHWKKGHRQLLTRIRIKEIKIG
jgi:large subunit ribosomal protein L21